MLIERNRFVSDPWVLEKITDRTVCDSFDCGDGDLNEYFHKDVILYRKLLLTESYYLHLTKQPEIAMALVDFCNDTINLEKIKGKIEVPQGKPQRYWPAVKVTRLGVTKDLQRQNVGTKILNMVKEIFITDNRTGCRFVTVDALKDKGIINFYQNAGFEIYPSKDKGNIRTVLLYYDLKRPILS